MPWRLQQALTPEYNSPENPINSSTPEPVIVDLIENDEIDTNSNVEHPTTNSGMEVLTAPDLQLDWLSDTSSDDEIVCTTDNNKLSSQNQNGTINLTIPTTAMAPIDLTASDDEESNQTNSNNSNSNIVDSTAWAPGSLYNCLVDQYHNATRNLNNIHNPRHSNDGHLNCRSAYSTCDCLESDMYVLLYLI